MEWGGARLRLENPAAATAATAGRADTARQAAPLPEGPLLYVVHIGEGGARALVLPVARIAAGTLAGLDLPEAVDAAYRTRFDAAFLPPGLELALVAGGSRVGSVVIGGERLVLGDGCPSTAAADPLLLPGGGVPPSGFALPPGLAAAPPVRWAPREPDVRIRTYAPILAERILREAAEPRPWLARLMSLAPVPAGEGTPAMAATYLIGDTLAPVPPPGEAVSLFFLARFDGASSAYEPSWSIVRRYASAEEKEAYAWRERLQLGGQPVDLLLRVGQGPARLAVSPVSEGERRIDWVESERCPSAALLAEATGG